MDVFDAAKKGHFERIKAVVEQDAGLVHATDRNLCTPLLYAAQGGHVEVARYLLSHGARIHHPGAFRFTALHHACSRSHKQVVLLLLQRGADVTAVDHWGSTPLMTAATVGCDAVVRVQLEHDCRAIDARDWAGGMTASHRACSEGHSGVLRQLLEAGADPTVRDSAGRTSFDRATGEGHDHCVNVLQEWHRAYTLYRTRSVRDAALLIGISSALVDAAPTYLSDRATSGLNMPTVHASPCQQHEQPSDDVGEKGDAEVDPVAVGGVVTVYAIEELNGEVFLELMELVSITGSVLCS